MRYPVVILALAACLAGHALTAGTIKFRTLAFRHEDDIREVLVPAPTEKGMLKVPLYTSTYSDSMEMQVTDGVAVFSVDNPESTSAKNAYRPVAKAKVPAATRVLFVFLPPAKDDDKAVYRVLALPDDTNAFPWGHLRLLNIAPVPARFHLGEFSGKAAKTLKSGELATLGRVRKLNAYNMYNVVIEFLGEDGFIPVSNTRWKCVDIKRDLAIAYFDPKSRRPVVNLYQDIQPADLP